MICLKRNKRTIYLCKAKENSLEFEEPISFNVNYRPRTSELERLTVGQDYSMEIRIKCTVKEGQNFSNGDKCYVEVKPPEEHDNFCSDADYIVDGDPKITLNGAEINLRKLSGNF